MFRRRRRFKKDPLDYITLPKLDLDPQTKKGIFIVLMVAFGAICLLALFNKAGVVGIYLAPGLTLLFGWSKWLVPIILLVLGLIFLFDHDNKYNIRGSTYLGLFLFIISLQIILHYFLKHSEWKEMVAYGAGGGISGFYLASIFYKLLGFWGGLVLALGIFLISLMLMFNTTLTQLLGPESWLAKLLYHPIAFVFNKAFRKGEREYLDDEEEIGMEEEEEGEEEMDDETEDTGAIFSKKRVEEEGALSEIYFNDKGRTKSGEKEEKLWKWSNVKIDLPLDLLNGRIGKPTSGDIKNNVAVIQKALENFGIPVEMGEVNVGPTVTQYTFKPAEGVKLSRITALGNDLALALAAHPIRIEAPIPGKSLVGVEVPNQAKAIVGLKEILSSKGFKERKSNLMLALGKDVSGRPWTYDLAKMPHLLVAGATNSGKSVCLNSIIVSLLYQNNPDDARFIMVDPKRVELTHYNGLPHLLTPVIVEVNKTINALRWCLNEMDRRFEILNKSGKRDISSFNIGVNGSSSDASTSLSAYKMPHIVFVIDELADLMVAAGRDIEAGIIRLAQMARAVGIHLVLATQRPSVDVITGLIKVNMPARIAFSVASGTDSRTILDSLGAEKLLGRGDMLFISAEMSKPKRLQGAFVSESEIKKIVNYINSLGGEPQYVSNVTEKQKVSGIAGAGLEVGDEIDDELLEEAKEVILNYNKASASFLQRRLSIGFARASRILDALEEQGIVSPADGSKPREILLTKEQYDKMRNQGVSGVALHKREESKAPDEYLDDSSGNEAGIENKEGLEESEDISENNKEEKEEWDKEGKYFSR